MEIDKKNVSYVPTRNRWNPQVRMPQRGFFTKGLITNEWIIWMDTNSAKTPGHQKMSKSLLKQRTIKNKEV